MARKVTIGPKIKREREVVVNVEHDDQANPTGSSVHIKVVLPVIEGETEDGHIKRAADAVKRMADRLSEEIAAGAYAARLGVKWPDEDEGEQAGG